MSKSKQILLLFIVGSGFFLVGCSNILSDLGLQNLDGNQNNEYGDSQKDDGPYDGDDFADDRGDYGYQNQAPTAPTIALAPNQDSLIVISSFSYDNNNDNLIYRWFVDNAVTSIATGTHYDHSGADGVYQITCKAFDGQTESPASNSVTVTLSIGNP